MDNQRATIARQFKKGLPVFRIIAGLLVFYLGIVACYVGAQRHWPWLGPVVVGIIVITHLAHAERPAQEAMLIALVGLCGFLLDSALISLQVYAVTPDTRWLFPAPLCPDWILALWVNAATQLSRTLPMTRRKYLRSAIIGLVFGVLVYKRAAAVHLLTLPDAIVTLLLIAVIWAMVLPLFSKFAALIMPPATGEAQPRPLVAQTP